MQSPSSPILDGMNLDDYDSDDFDELLHIHEFDVRPPDADDDNLDHLHENDRRRIESTAKVDEQWTDCKISDIGEPVLFNLDSARNENWKALQEEVDFLRGSLSEILKEMNPQKYLNRDPDASSSPQTKLKELFDLTFGKESEMSKMLCKELNIGREKFAQFMGNLCLQMAYKETPSSLFDEDSKLLNALTMDEESYMEIWKTIANKKKVDLNSFHGASRRKECLWVKAETIVNKLLRELSVAGRNGDIVVALDDDKIWVECSGRNTQDDFGLRQTTHNQDNRHGIVAHVAVTSTTNIPICFVFHRKDETAVDCFLRVFTELFPNTGNKLPDLSGVHNHSDRGYTLDCTVFDFLLPAGADFTNTVKQIMPFPFYWSAKSYGKNETRQRLNPNGAPTLFIKEMMKHERLVSCSAFRTGTKNISTIISSVIHGHQWEGFCMNQKQRIEYEKNPTSGLDSLVFPKLASAGDELVKLHEIEMGVMLDALKLQKIDVLTLEQGTADWHKGRQFSLTSSQSDASFQKAIIVNQDSEDWLDVAEHLYGKQYHTELRGLRPRRIEAGVGQDAAAPPAPPAVADEVIPPLAEDDNGGDNNGEDEREAEPKQVDFFESLLNSTVEEEEPLKFEALTIIKDRLLHDPEGTPIDDNNDLLSKPKANLCKKILELLVSRIPEVDRKSQNGKASLKKWLGSSNAIREYLFLTKDAMIRIGATKCGIRMQPNLSFDKMIETLVRSTRVDEERTAPRAATHPRRGRRNNVAVADAAATTLPPPSNQATTTATPIATHNEQVTAISNEITKALLEKSFMKPLKGDKREHCRVGHKLEIPIGLSWMKDLNEKKMLPGYQVVSLHKVGLVQKKNCPWAKDSIDFLAFVFNSASSDLELWGVEVKSRQTVKTVNEEREFGRKLHRKKYEIIPCDKAHKWINKRPERFQLLHHSYVYGIKRVILVIANNSAAVITGTVVEYNEKIHDSYGNVMEKLKKMALDWAYTDVEAENVIIPDNVISMSKQIPTINGKEAIYGALKLWKVMFSDPNLLPRPAMQRIIPAAHALWNTTKGGSDTVTKIADDCFAKPPRNYTNYESVALLRCISNLLITVLKLYHVISAQKDVSQYPTMQHYRNAASHRMRYKALLKKMHKLFKAEVDESEKENEPPIECQATTSADRARRARAHGHSTVPEKMGFAIAKKTFQTPERARKKQVEAGKVSDIIAKRINNCTGSIFEVVQQIEGDGRDPRRECFVCKTKTPWQCTGCRLHFCMNYKANKRREEKLYYIREKLSKDSDRKITKIYGKTCFHAAHECSNRPNEG